MTPRSTQSEDVSGTRQNCASQLATLLQTPKPTRCPEQDGEDGSLTGKQLSRHQPRSGGARVSIPGSPILIRLGAPRAFQTSPSNPRPPLFQSLLHGLPDQRCSLCWSPASVPSGSCE